MTPHLFTELTEQNEVIPERIIECYRIDYILMSFQGSDYLPIINIPHFAESVITSSQTPAEKNTDW